MKNNTIICTAMLLVLFMALSFFPPVAAFAWDADEAYEHNRAMRERLESLEMCGDMRAFFLLPVMELVQTVSMRRILGARFLDEFPSEIISLSQEITEGLTDDYEKARSISGWVSRNVHYHWEYIRNPGPRITDALGVLESRRTVCEGFANLTISLLRSVGIPANYVRGLARHPGETITEAEGHAWVEAFVGEKWIIIDPTWMAGNRNRYFDISLRDISTSHRYLEIYAPLFLYGLITDEETGTVIGSIADTSEVLEVAIPCSITVLDDTLRLRSPDVRDENRHIRPFPKLERLVLPEGFTSLNTAVFSESRLSEAVLPGSLERIGPNAFAATELSEIAFPQSLRFVGEGAFAGTSLGFVAFPYGIETVRASAFEDAGLYAAYIPAGASGISSAAFDGNPYLVIYGYQGTFAESFAFHNGFPFVAVESFEVAGDFAVDGGTLLFPTFERGWTAEVGFPSGITAIGSYAFRNFAGLRELSVPDNIASIGIGAFSGSYNLEAVFIPPGVTYISDEAFEGASRLVIYGHPGSAAEAFALDNGLEFVNAAALREPTADAAEVPVLEARELPASGNGGMKGFPISVLIAGTAILAAVIIVIVALRAIKRR